jgi:hypothetical protein
MSGSTLLGLPPATILVVGLSVFLLVTSLAGVYLASRSPSVPPARRPGVFLAVGGTLVVWFALVFALGLGGAFRITTAEEFRPTLLLAVLLSTAFAFVLPLWLAPFRLVLNALPQHWLIVVHVFRVGFGSVFLLQLAQGLLPAEFALSVGIGDVVVGAAAPLVAYLVLTQRPGWHAAALIWNVAGMLDFLDTVVIVTLAAPGPYQQLVLTPPLIPGAFPQSLLPTFVVPLYWLLHLCSVRGLLQRPVLAPQPAY